MDILDLLNDAYAFNGDPLFKKAHSAISDLRDALQHILTHCKSDSPPNAQALILFANKALGDK